jgi:hypothetical protein
VRALVTGARGQIASYLIPILEASGHEVFKGTFEDSPLGREIEEFDQIYLLHIVRDPEANLGRMLHSGVADVGYYLSFKKPGAKLLVAGSVLEFLPGMETDPYRVNLELTGRLLNLFPNTLYPRLCQFVSPKGSPERMYLMRVLRQLARGEVPRPERPWDLVYPAHAQDGAHYLKGLMESTNPRYPNKEAYTIERFIQAAQTKGHWLNGVVEELRASLTGK